MGFNSGFKGLIPVQVVQIIYIATGHLIITRNIRKEWVLAYLQHCPKIGLKGMSKIINQHRVSKRVLSHTFRNLHGLSQIIYLLRIVYVFFFNKFRC